MAQADYVISPNPTGLAMRTEVNQIFQAILTSNAGNVAPSTTQAGMLWGDTGNSSTYYLKIRNHTNDGWASLYAYDVATKTIQPMSNGSTLTTLLALKADLANPTFTGTVVLPSTTSIGTVSNTEIGYLDGVTSAIQTQLGTKAPLSSPALTGTPTAPTAVVTTDNTQIATTAFVRDIIPTGIISMWSGSIVSIPSGWALCDGNNGTPNLLDRFVISAGSTYSVGATGGSKDAITVSHTHTATTSTTGSHQHNLRLGSGNDSNAYGALNGSGRLLGGMWSGNLGTISWSTVDAGGNSLIDAQGSHSHTLTTDSSGSSGTNANLPPYLALAYIMKL